MKFEARRTRGTFEQKDVTKCVVTLGSKTLDLDFPLLLDEHIQITLRAEVVGVHHDVNQRTGQLIRKHIVKISGTEVQEA